MGCRCSNLREESVQQERFVRRNFNSFNRELKAKYDRPQIESKLRQMYYGTDTLKKIHIFLTISGESLKEI